MSTLERPPDPGVPTSKLQRRNLSSIDRVELEKLDAIFERIKRAVPTAPYVLSTPSLNPYTHYSRHESQSWMVGHLFQPDEEHLQYRTFHYREPYQDCFTLQPGEEDEPEVERPRSPASNTASQVPKKKISLSAYKSKQANGVIAPGTKKTSPGLPPTKAPPVQINGTKGVDRQTSTAPKAEEVQSHKRSATESLSSEKPEKRLKEDRSIAPPSHKNQSAESKMNLDTTGPSNATPHGLPPMLSPVDQPLSNPYGLPDILSPTLPSNIQVELDKIEIKRKRAESDASNSSGQLLSIPDSQPLKREEGAATNTRVRSISINGKSPNNALPSRADPTSLTLIVKLKYGKKMGATVAQLLRLPPSRRVTTTEKKERQEDVKEQRPVKAQAKLVDGIAAKTDGTAANSKDPPKITSRRPETSTANAKTATGHPKVAEKRPRSEDDSSLAVPAKRPRAQTLEGPRTPSQQMITSPTKSNKSSAQKGQGPFTTPRRDHKAVSMLRANSIEGNDSTQRPLGVS